MARKKNVEPSRAYRGRHCRAPDKSPKSDQPPVTILIPTFNRRHFLPLALKSALGQTYGNIRVIVYDDGSSDTTLNWLQDHADERVTVIAGRVNGGIAAARETLLEATSTEFNAWLDSDDMRNVYSIDLQMAVMQKWNPPFVRTSTQVLISETRWKRPPGVSYSKRHSIATSLFRKSCAPKFRTDLRYFGEDIIWEMDMVTEHGTGIMIPFDCYYIGRGRHGRLTAGVNSKPKKRNKAHYDKLKRQRGGPLMKMGINPACRVERIAPGDIGTPFNLGAGVNPQLPPIFKAANLCTSQRLKTDAALHPVTRCPLCGFKLDRILCPQCGKDWSDRCWWVPPPEPEISDALDPEEETPDAS